MHDQMADCELTLLHHCHACPAHSQEHAVLDLDAPCAAYLWGMRGEELLMGCKGKECLKALWAFPASWQRFSCKSSS